MRDQYPEPDEVRKAAPRGTTNRNDRGSALSRRARRQWLLDTYGDGQTAPCAFDCGTTVDATTMTVDRYPIPGCQGGTYRRGNIRPACQPCNSRNGGGVRRGPVAHPVPLPTGLREGW